MPRIISKILISEHTKNFTYFVTRYMLKEEEREDDDITSDEKDAKTPKDPEDDITDDEEEIVSTDEKETTTATSSSYCKMEKEKFEEVQVACQVNKRFILVTYKDRPKFGVEYKGEAYHTEHEIEELVRNNPLAHIYPNHFESKYRSFL